MTTIEPRWIKLDWRMPGLSERVLQVFADQHGIDVDGAEVLVVNPSDTFTYRMHDGSSLVVHYDYDGAPDAEQDLTIHKWSWTWSAS